MLSDAGSALSGLSRYAGLVMAPKVEHPFKQVEFLPLSPGRALVVVVADNGMLENRVIQVPVGIGASSLIEAGKDLYHGPVRTFFSVTLPATRAGLYGGVLLVFLPALGDFVSAQLLGGAGTYMIGNLVQQQFNEGQNWPLGSALSVVTMTVVTMMALACVFIIRQAGRRVR